MLRELEELGRCSRSRERPFVAIVGGAKVEDKIGVLALARRAGGRDPRRRQDGRGDPRPPDRRAGRAPLGRGRRGGVRARTRRRRSSPADAVPEGWLGLDIGPETREGYAKRIATAKTVFWNGPMGVFEWPRFAEGTNAIAQAVADADAHTVVGGGDSVRAIEEAGLADRIDWVSTGGGASLELH